MLSPNTTYTLNGVLVKEKIIPDGTVWQDDAKAQKCGFHKGSLYKKQCKLTDNTGIVKFITVHNTPDLGGAAEDAELYTRATYYENMGSARVHFYVDDISAWQNLKAGLGLSPNDPKGSAEVGWHAGDKDAPRGGNMTSLGIEIIMGSDIHEQNVKAYDNGARFVAALMKAHGLDIDHVVSHTYWVNESLGKHFADVDYQCTNIIAGKKWCPSYIFNSNSPRKARTNWLAFKDVVMKYYNADSDKNTDYEIGDKIKIKDEVTKYANGGKIPSWVKDSVLYARKFLDDERVAFSIESTGDLTGIIYKKDAYLVESQGFKIGDIVKMKEGATTYASGQKMPDWVINSQLKIQGFQDEKKKALIVVYEGKDVGSDITGIVFTKDLEPVKETSCDKEHQAVFPAIDGTSNTVVSGEIKAPAAEPEKKVDESVESAPVDSASPQSESNTELNDAPRANFLTKLWRIIKNFFVLLFNKRK